MGPAAGLDSYKAYTVEYDAVEAGYMRDKGTHFDNAEVTLNISLTDEHEGGELYFVRWEEKPAGHLSHSSPTQCNALIISYPTTITYNVHCVGMTAWSRWSTGRGWGCCTAAARCTAPCPWRPGPEPTSSSGSGAQRSVDSEQYEKLNADAEDIG